MQISTPGNRATLYTGVAALIIIVLASAGWAVMYLRERLPPVAFLRAINEKGDMTYDPGALTPSSNNFEYDYFIQLKDNPDAGLYISKPLIGRLDKKWICFFVRCEAGYEAEPAVI